MTDVEKSFEREWAIRSVLVRRECDVCKVGAMRPTNTMLPTSPPKFPHRCSNADCGHTETFNQTYPFVRHYHDDDWNTGPVEDPA